MQEVILKLYLNTLGLCSQHDNLYGDNCVCLCILNFFLKLDLLTDFRKTCYSEFTFSICKTKYSKVPISSDLKALILNKRGVQNFWKEAIHLTVLFFFKYLDHGRKVVAVYVTGPWNCSCSSSRWTWRWCDWHRGWPGWRHWRGRRLKTEARCQQSTIAKGLPWSLTLFVLPLEISKRWR